MQPLIFDAAALARNRRRAHTAPQDALWQAMVERMHERLEETAPHATHRVLIAPYAAPALGQEHHAPDELLQLPPQRCEAVLHLAGLHLANDVLGILVQMRLALAPGGVMIAMFPGGDTLRELRAALAAGESKVLGGISPRVIPFLNPEEGGNLLSRAGFKEPVIDRDSMTLTYPDLTTLMHELRSMGQSNPLLARRKYFTPRALFTEAERYYHERFVDEKGHLKMTMELVTFTAWV